MPDSQIPHGAFRHTSKCEYCGVVDPTGFECCQECSDRLAAQFAKEDEEDESAGNETA